MAQCGNLVIFLSLRFYVQSNSSDFGVSRSAILIVLAPLNLRLDKSLQFFKLKCSKNQNAESPKWSKLQFLSLLIDFT